MPHIDMTTRNLDTLFTLSRVTLDVDKLDTANQAFDLLTRAEKFLHPPFPTSSSSEHANFVRCVSGAYFNIGGTLYQAGRHATAVRFVKRACELGKEAVNLRRSNPLPHEEDLKDAEAWRTLEDGLFRRWELLGVCYSKMEDRKVCTVLPLYYASE